MKKGNTREEILEVSLDLFSVNGYEATSIAQIADAVGIRKASLYSHFAGKQEILDSVAGSVLSGYEKNSIFANADWEDQEYTKDKKGLDAEAAAKSIQGQIRYMLHDPDIKRGRKMLTIEQFRNEELAQLHTRISYEDILKYFEGMIRFLIREKKLRDADVKIMSAQLSSPIMVWINLCDREPGRENEVMDLVRRHVVQFFDVYSK